MHTREELRMAATLIDGTAISNAIKREVKAELERLTAVARTIASLDGSVTLS